MIKTLNFEAIRASLESTYSHVTFVSSHNDGKTSKWYVTTIGTECQIPFYVCIVTGELYVTHNHCSLDGHTMQTLLIANGGVEMVENKTNKLEENKMSNVIIGEGVVKTLGNGTEVLDVEIKNNFVQAQAILDINPNTEVIDAHSAYDRREFTQFDGTYKVKIRRQNEYDRFHSMLMKENCFYTKKDSLHNQYHLDVITREEWEEAITELGSCKCSLCTVKVPNFREWQNNTIEVIEYNEYLGKDVSRTYKLGKYLKKCGVSDELILFYSQQIKSERDIYLTITGAPQYVAGMSNYAKARSWDGYMGTSCMDTRHQGNYCVQLAGALYDDRLHVAMLHERLDDLENMQDKLLARVIMRPVEYQGEMVLIPTRYYGNNETKAQLNTCLKALRELGIYSLDVVEIEQDHDEIEEIEMSANGSYEMEVTKTETMEEYVSEWVSCDCPLCGGGGDITREVELESRYASVTVECPMCEGSGNYETYVDETFEVEYEATETVEVYPYHDNEGDHYQYCEYDNTYTMAINVTMIERDFGLE